MRRATSTTQRDLASTKQENQRLMAQLQAMQNGQQIPPEQAIFMRGRQAALQEFQMRNSIVEIGKKAGLDLEPYSPEVDRMLGTNPVEGYTNLASALADSYEKRRRELEREYKEKANNAEVSAHEKWSTSSSAKVPSVNSGTSTDTDYLGMDSAKFAETKARMIAEAKSRRR